MDIKTIKDEIFEKATQQGFTSSEVSYSQGKSFQARMFKGEVAEYKNASMAGLSFRGVYNGQMGYAYTERIERSVIDTLLENARENSSVIEEESKEKLFAGSASYQDVNVYNDALQEVTATEKIELAKKMEDYALACDERVKSVLQCSIASGDGTEGIYNTLGLDLQHRGNYLQAFVAVQVSDGNQTKVASEIFLGRNLADFSPEALAKAAVEKAVSYLGASTVASGKYPVVFDNLTSSDMLRCFVNAFFAERVQKGFSLYKGKVNEQIASAVVSIRDDGVYRDSLGNVPFDSEGVATTNKSVVQDGVLKTFLYNLKSAEKDNTTTTGNGFRPSFKGAVGTSCTNLYIQPSDLSLEAVLAKMGSGILITELAGLHSGTNTVSGDFSLSADGYLIEGGKIVRPVEQITVAGNYYQLLRDVVAVGGDLRFDSPSGLGTIGSPCIYVSELSIAGGA